MSNICEVVAKNDFVVITVGNPKRPGTEVVSPGGIVMGRSVTGEQPTTGIVISVGPDVKNICVGDRVLLPLNTGGELVHVTHPDVVNGLVPDEKSPERLVATRESAIRAVYK